MKKTFKIEVDCANCANKVQESISKMEHVNSVLINFMTQKMIIDIDDNYFDETLLKVIKQARKIEPDFEVYK